MGDTANELDLLALGILLGSATLRKEWGADFFLEGSLQDVWDEVKAGDVGPAVRKLLERLGVEAGDERATTRILRTTKRRNSERRLVRLTGELFRMTQLRMDGASIAAKVKEIADESGRLPTGATGGTAAANEAKEPAAVRRPDRRVGGVASEANGSGAKQPDRS